MTFPPSYAASPLASAIQAYQLGFLLSSGYFKAARRFFSPGSFHPRDIEYVARQLEPGAPTVDFAQYHPRTRQRHQHMIRTFYGFRACDSAASRLLLTEIAGLVRSQVKPKVIASPRLNGPASTVLQLT
ncbi:MAG: DUF4158 domain-containing protein [Verrucomicrobia bacterium]|nr:DUF4158 domain-containing protein [Verrucomicrobiota bacterium]